MIHTGSNIRHRHPGTRRAAVAIPVVLLLSVLAWLGVAALLG
ncbi:hypothetical protein ACETKC_16520 [Brevundimonas intermedia]|jgi:hypothetical protein|nr:hypothetical protein [Brevundimonas intermedia]